MAGASQAAWRGGALCPLLGLQRGLGHLPLAGPLAALCHCPGTRLSCSDKCHSLGWGEVLNRIYRLPIWRLEPEAQVWQDSSSRGLSPRPVDGHLLPVSPRSRPSACLS